jgi:hypothetical protein
MRKLVNWILPAVLGITQVFAAEETDQTFCNQPGAVYSINYAFDDMNPQDNSKRYVAAVDRTIAEPFSTKQREVVARFRNPAWAMNDVNKIGILSGTVFIICNGQQVTKSYTHQEGTPYEIVSRIERARFCDGNQIAEDQSLPVGKEVEVRQATTYKRPDNSLFIEQGNLLYKLILEEEVKPRVRYAVCINHNHHGGKNPLQTRHDLQLAAGGDVVQKTFQIVDGIKQLDDEKTVKVLEMQSHVWSNRGSHDLSQDASDIKIIFDSKMDAQKHGWIVK